MPDSLLPDCPKCGLHLPDASSTCPKCGLVFSKWAPDRQRTYSSQVIVSTASLGEPFETIGPVYTVTTNLKGALDSAARKLGLDVTAVTGNELMEAFVLGDPVANYRAFPVAFAVCVEHLKQQAAALGADAVIGVRMNFDLDRSGAGLSAFTMQLFGTAVRRGAKAS